MAERTQSQTSGPYIPTRPKVQLQSRNETIPHTTRGVDFHYFKKVLFYAVNPYSQNPRIHPHLPIQGKL